jgi:hypothetical protein
MRRTLLLPALLFTVASAFAQQTPDAAGTQEPDRAAPQSQAFAGGLLTITENDDYQKVVAFDGKELARNYVAFFDRELDLSGTPVALVAVGDGGNMCGAAALIVWKPEDDEVQSLMVGEECGAPPAAATEDSLYFVPFLVPGESSPVQVWSPDEGLRQAGIIAYAPQPDTTWADLDAASMSSIVDAFGNADVYVASQALLGSDLTDFATGLLTGGGVETIGDTVLYGSGCVPHACGAANAFMAVDPAARALYLAQQSDGDIRTWPARDAWPSEILKAMQASIGR